MKTTISTVIALLSLIIQIANAKATFPRGCEVSGFGFINQNLVLNENGQQSYYLIQNHSNIQVELERHATADVFMSPPLHAIIDPLNWGAFASDEKNLNFKCYKHQNENTVLIDCRDVLEVCQYPRVKFALSNMGNYWIAANKSQYDVIQESVAKGIYLKW